MKKRDAQLLWAAEDKAAKKLKRENTMITNAERDVRAAGRSNKDSEEYKALNDKLFELKLDLGRLPQLKQKPVDTAQKEIHRHAIQPISISNQQPITRRRLSLD